MSRAVSLVPLCSQGRMNSPCPFQPSQVPPVGSVWWGLWPLLSRLLAVHELEMQRVQPHGTPSPLVCIPLGVERESRQLPHALLRSRFGCL